MARRIFKYPAAITSIFSNSLCVQTVALERRSAGWGPVSSTTKPGPISRSRNLYLGVDSGHTLCLKPANKE